jgi:hypothetical protein
MTTLLATPEVNDDGEGTVLTATHEAYETWHKPNVGEAAVVRHCGLLYPNGKLHTLWQEEHLIRDGDEIGRDPDTNDPIRSTDYTDLVAADGGKRAGSVRSDDFVAMFVTIKTRVEAD